MSTKAGDQLTLNFKGCDAGGYTSSVPTRMYCALHYDAALNIGGAGIQLLDQCKTPNYIHIYIYVKAIYVYLMYGR